MIVKRALARHSIPDLISLVIRGSFRVLTSHLRILPDFIIIGAQRCGTTSLYNYLTCHPMILPAFLKETHFFDLHFQKGVRWYQAHFPLAWYRNHQQQQIAGNLITGEATPYYIFYPHAPRRIFETVPDVKLILLLRNPVDRAYSHYHHEVKIGVETLSFEEAIGREEERLAQETTKILGTENCLSFNHMHHSYLTRGIYVDQLKHWEEFFSWEQLLILISEDFYENPYRTLAQVTSFLGLSELKLASYKKYNCARYVQMDTSTRQRLNDYFRPHNQRLYDYLGRDLGWEG